MCIFSKKKDVSISQIKLDLFSSIGYFCDDIIVCKITNFDEELEKLFNYGKLSSENNFINRLYPVLSSYEDKRLDKQDEIIKYLNNEP